MVIKLSESGLRIGESHGRAKFTDVEVELMRRLREQGWKLIDIARKFGTTKQHVSRICLHLQRATAVARCRVVTLLVPD